MKTEWFFKVLFWVITVVIVGAITALMGAAVPEMMEDPDFPFFMYAFFGGMLVLGAALLITIPVFVYKDAGRRGMNRWMWMTIATFVPNFLGIIIYLIVRNNNQQKCLNCGKSIKADYEVCPYCGQTQSIRCPKCGKPVAADWQACPYCKSNLVERNEL